MTIASQNSVANIKSTGNQSSTLSGSTPKLIPVTPELISTEAAMPGAVDSTGTKITESQKPALNTGSNRLSSEEISDPHTSLNNPLVSVLDSIDKSSGADHSNRLVEKNMKKGKPTKRQSLRKKQRVTTLLIDDASEEEPVEEEKVVQQTQEKNDKIPQQKGGQELRAQKEQSNSPEPLEISIESITAQAPESVPAVSQPSEASPSREVAQIPEPAQTPGIEGQASVQNNPVDSNQAEQKSIQKKTVTGNPDQLVVIHQSPVIDIKTTGPKRLVVGQESTYIISVRNTSSVDAENLVITTDIPQWVEVIKTKPNVGTSDIKTFSEQTDKVCNQWNAGTLPAVQEATLILTLVPRSGNNFELISKYDYKQNTIKTGIEVQEPILELALEGRDALEWGQEDKYRIRIRNIGTGDAQNIRLTVSTGPNEQATQIIKQLKSGEEKSMEMAIKTIADEELTITVDANGAYGLSANTSKTVSVLRGQLDLCVEAPELQFVNNSVDYLVHVMNTGTAPLQNVSLEAHLPESAEFVSCSGDGEENDGNVTWNISMLKPDEELVYIVTCNMVSAGISRMDVTAADRSGVTLCGEAIVQVEAIAALNMKIKSPDGPVAVGNSINYEIVVSNEGTKSAENILVGLFLSEGLIPVEGECDGFVHPDEYKVLFNQIDSLRSGQSVTYHVTAKVIGAGNHKVQAVLESRSDDIQLMSEEITHCYERRMITKRNMNSVSKVALRPTDNSSSHPDHVTEDQNSLPETSSLNTMDSNSGIELY
ncbi:MAG: hypothetical protein IKW74_05820 [Thermoguttaceae bacterium]|nr:hypothetical protein [Thermoguttaceae bacterium]